MIVPDKVLPMIKATCKRQALRQISEAAAKLYDGCNRQLLDALLERENIGSTGIGNGVAIPHVRLSGIQRMYGVFVALETPINYDSYDSKPVDLIYLLLAPDATQDNSHLQELSRVSRFMRDAKVCAKLREINQVGVRPKSDMHSVVSYWNDEIKAEA